MEELSVVADVLLTMELTVSSIPAGVPCYLDWRTEHTKGLTPVLKADRTGIINFGKVVTQATLVGSTGGGVEALMKVALFQAKEKGLLTGLLSQDKKNDSLLGDATFNCAEKVRIFARHPLQLTREADIKQFLLLDAPQSNSNSNARGGGGGGNGASSALASSVSNLHRKPGNFQLRVASECGVVRCRVGMDYFLVKGTEWVASNERECYSLGIDFLAPSPLVRLSGMRRTPKQEAGLGAQSNTGSQPASPFGTNNTSSTRIATRMPWKTESTNNSALASSSSHSNNNLAAYTTKQNSNPQLVKASVVHENKRELDRLADELLLLDDELCADKSGHGAIDAFLPSQERAANFRPRLARAMNEQEKEREREAEEARAATEKSAVDKYLECVMQSALKLKEQQQSQTPNSQQSGARANGGASGGKSDGQKEAGGGGRLGLFKGGLGLGKFTASRNQQQPEKEKKPTSGGETNPWVNQNIQLMNELVQLSNEHKKEQEQQRRHRNQEQQYELLAEMIEEDEKEARDAKVTLNGAEDDFEQQAMPIGILKELDDDERHPPSFLSMTMTHFSPSFMPDFLADALEQELTDEEIVFGKSENLLIDVLTEIACGEDESSMGTFESILQSGLSSIRESIHVDDDDAARARTTSLGVESIFLQSLRQSIIRRSDLQRRSRLASTSNRPSAIERAERERERLAAEEERRQSEVKRKVAEEVFQKQMESQLASMGSFGRNRGHGLKVAVDERKRRGKERDEEVERERAEREAAEAKAREEEEWRLMEQAEEQRRRTLLELEAQARAEQDERARYEKPPSPHHHQQQPQQQVAGDRNRVPERAKMSIPINSNGNKPSGGSPRDGSDGTCNLQSPTSPRMLIQQRAQQCGSGSRERILARAGQGQSARVGSDRALHPNPHSNESSPTHQEKQQQQQQQAIQMTSAQQVDPAMRRTGKRQSPLVPMENRGNGGNGARANDFAEEGEDEQENNRPANRANESHKPAYTITKKPAPPQTASLGQQQQQQQQEQLLGRTYRALATQISATVAILLRLVDEFVRCCSHATFGKLVANLKLLRGHRESMGQLREALERARLDAEENDEECALPVGDCKMMLLLVDLLDEDCVTLMRLFTKNQQALSEEEMREELRRKQEMIELNGKRFNAAFG